MSAPPLPYARRSCCLDNIEGKAAHPGPRILSIPHDLPFARTLAAGLLAEQPDPLERARTLLLLPSRRSVTALGTALLQAADGRAALLPKMAAIGDVDEDEALGRFAEADGDAPILPPAITPLARRLALARIAARAFPIGPVSALALGDSLGRVLDQLVIHGVPLSALHDLALPDMAGHWERNRAILALVAAEWPALLADRGLMGDAERRETLLAALADRWSQCPPASRVIAAGFAAAPPAVARLLGVVARMPGGALILPGLDTEMDAELAEAAAAPAGASHPAHGMLGLLAAIGATPAEVRPWPHGQRQPARAARAAAMQHALLPAALAHRWQATDAPGVSALTGVHLLETRGADEEALAIALAMRRTLETPEATAALVTPSRPLARRVAGELARFGLRVDDSAGQSLRLRPRGVLLQLMAAAAAARLAPVSLLALLKQPLIAATDDAARAHWLAQVRALDLALRRLPPPPGSAGVTARLQARLADAEPYATEAAADLLHWWTTDAAPRIAPLDRLFATGPETLAALLAALLAAGETLVGPSLFAEQDGRALSRLLDEVQAAETGAESLAVPADAAARTIGALLDSVTVRPPWQQHPRLAIRGPLEARLQSADLLILGGLNEGSWPAEPPIDPWLAPAVRTALGLPPAAARIGLMAHDLMGALSAPRILLTRARRDDSGATVASRFLLRLEAALGRLPADEEVENAMRLDGGEQARRFARPEPAPPPAARPKRLSATDADLLAADPFSFYAKRILRTVELDPLEQSADAAVRGIAIHNIAEALGRDPTRDPVPLIDAELAKLGDAPGLQTLWRPRLIRMMEWLVSEIGRDAASGWAIVVPEAEGEVERQGIRLYGRADRVDRNREGELRIIDYKSGSVPRAAAFTSGNARQLPLLRLILEAGGFPKVAPADVVSLLYVKLSGSSSIAGKVEGGKWTLDKAEFAADLDGLLKAWLLGDAPFLPKVKPVYADAFRRWDHLARLEEWLGRD